MAHIGGDTGDEGDDIVQGQLSHLGVELEQEGQGLANATSGTHNSDLHHVCGFFKGEKNDGKKRRDERREGRVKREKTNYGKRKKPEHEK